MKIHTVRLIVGVAGLVVVGGIVAGSRFRQGRDLYRENVGTVRSLDLARRTASVEIIHPRTGQTFRMEGQLPEGCPVTLDGKPADFGEIQVGDRVLLKRTGMKLLAVDIRRSAAGDVCPAASASAPATTAPAGGAGLPGPGNGYETAALTGRR